jgi:hypothetical protein
MDYQVDYRVDLDPAHSVIRLTVTAETVTLELAEDIYRHISEVTSQGGPYAAIFDLSRVKRSTIPAEAIRSFALRTPRCLRGETPRGGGQRAIEIRIIPYVSTISGFRGRTI